MTALTAIVLANDASKPGILDTLPPWGLVLAGIALLLFAGTLFWFNCRKLDEGVFI